MQESSERSKRRGGVVCNVNYLTLFEVVLDVRRDINFLEAQGPGGCDLKIICVW